MPSWRKSKNGLKKRFILTTHENCEEFISATPRMRNLKKPSRTRVRSWKHQLLLLCPVNYEELWEWLMQNSNKTFAPSGRWWIQKTAYGNSIPSNHEDHIAGKGENSLQHYNLIHKFVPMPQAMKILAAKAAVDKEWGKIGENFGVELDESKKQVIDEARTSGATVHFATNGQNHGPVWKTQSFLLKGICTVILWQDYYGKGNLRKSYWNSLFVVKKDYSHLTQTGWKDKILIRCGSYSTKKLIWENQHLSLIMYTWDVLNDNAK